MNERSDTPVQYVEQKTEQIEKLLAYLETCNTLGKRMGRR